jgi:hypothetical protein
MAISMNDRGYRHAHQLIKEGQRALNERDARAGQYDHDDVQQAAAHLHGMLDALRDERS